MDGATGSNRTTATRTKTVRLKGEKKNHTDQPFIFFKKTSKLRDGESFFALDPEREPPRTQTDKAIPATGKILPLSQPLQKQSFPCNICNRKFTSKGGRTNHLKICSRKNAQNADKSTEAIAKNTTTPELTSQQSRHQTPKRSSCK